MKLVVDDNLTEFDKHIIKRMGTYPLWNDVHIDLKNEIVTFLLWSADERLNGILKYTWKLDKTKQNCGKYITYGGKGSSKLFGLSYIYDFEDTIFIVEGCMDAISVRIAGYQVLATMSNCVSKDVKKYLHSLPNTIAICEGDKAGLELAKLAKTYLVLEQGQDANSTDIEKLKQILKDKVHEC